MNEYRLLELLEAYREFVKRLCVNWHGDFETNHDYYDFLTFDGDEKKTVDAYKKILELEDFLKRYGS